MGPRDAAGGILLCISCGRLLAGPAALNAQINATSRPTVKPALGRLYTTLPPVVAEQLRSTSRNPRSPPELRCYRLDG